MNFIKIIVFTICLWSVYDKCTGDATCPDTTWTATRNHCYKQTVGVVNTEAEAKTKCAALGSGAIPVTVHNDDDNKDLTAYIATLTADTSFYIGLEYKAGTPVGEWDWLDGGNTKTYNLWDHTTDPSGAYPCAQITVVNKVASNWITNDCKQPVQSVVCQIPIRSLDSLYEELLKIKDKVQKLEAKVDKVIVPIGFVYVQLPNQAAPAQIWGAEFKWSDVTAAYAGLFFRAEGGGSAQFNPTGVTVQTASIFSNFTITSEVFNGVTHSSSTTWVDHEIKEQIMSDDIVSGLSDVALHGMQIFIDVKDAHPKNTAVKIWLRTG